MATGLPRVSESVVIPKASLQKIFDNLRASGFSLLGPTVREGAVILEEIARIEDLPAGWTDVQEGGTYRLKRRDDEALFGYTHTPQSWKKFLHPPAVRLWQAKRDGNSFQVATNSQGASKYAFVGVRSCELHAIAIQDRVFLQGEYVDPSYKQRREKAFILAVNCGQAGGTCFCVSMKTGPKADSGFDLGLTEILEGGHRFLVEVGTNAGAEMLNGVEYTPAGDEDRAAGERVVAKAAQEMGRSLDTADIKDLLYRNYDHPRWDHVAARCLACTNCTMVCPTCFCTTVEDVTDLTGQEAERWRKWDSCFTLDFSYIHGGSIRPTPRARYRQWMTHKLATWIDQFGTSGCVGCGRCITWCPVGIDITEEARVIRETEPVASNPSRKEDYGKP
jgi:sulfhydrogenase subunit beta (sulfur reductase)